MKDVQIVQYDGDEVRDVTTGSELAEETGLEFAHVVRLLRELDRRRLLKGSFHTRDGS